MPTDSTKRTAPLSVAIIGVGAIGSTFAFHLAAAGNAVTVVARPASDRLQTLLRDQAIVLKTGQRARVTVTERLDQEVPYDLVLVTTLDHQVDALLPALSRCKAGAIQFMFNTFRPEQLSAAVGSDRCSFGMQFVMAKLDGQDRLDAKISAGQKMVHGDTRWVELFERSGMPSRHEPRMALWLRCHVPICVAMESICIVAQRRGGGASWAHAAVVARGLRAGFGIVQGSGLELYPPSKALIGRWPTPLSAGMLWFVSRVPSFRTLLATSSSECRSLIDVLANAAQHSNPAMPENAALVLAMKPERITA